jgi:hypothetical protein
MNENKYTIIASKGRQVESYHGMTAAETERKRIKLVKKGYTVTISDFDGGFIRRPLG